MSRHDHTAPFPGLEGRHLRRLASGRQATVSLVRLGGHHDPPDIVVKAFRPGAAIDAVIDEEVAALNQLRSLVDGREIEGWTIAVPRVVGVSRRPPRLALTPVPGAGLDTLFRRGWVPPPEFGAALAGICRRYWEHAGRPLGDVNLENFLCDPEPRRLSIVDPGLPDPGFELPHQPRRFYPASRDLGCLLHQVLSTNVSLRLGRSNLADVRLALVRSVIEAAMAGAAPRDAFLAEVIDCAAAHLARVRGGGVVQKAWRVTVRLLAKRALPAQAALLREASCA
jgi:hypothetical protein